MPLDHRHQTIFAMTGHVSITGVFTPERMDACIADVMAWSDDTLAAIGEDQRAWYLERGVSSAVVLRKLDNPHSERRSFSALAADPALVDLVEAILGPGVSVCFSQVFMKAPGGSGPKPVHQDNFYFGPSDPDGIVTAWVALDGADLENGCLYFGDGSHRGPVYPHVAPSDEPYNLQLPLHIAERQPMMPAPVAKGGVSFHHGNTFHASADNRSDRWRRACAIHYMRNDVRLATPALPYDETLIRRIT